MLHVPMASVARACLPLMGNRLALNEKLAASLVDLPHCTRLYALNADGVQLSDTVTADGLHSMTDLVEARDLVKVYPDVRAVDGISFRVRRGQCFGLLGPNGAGKTTTLEILEGISSPTSGQVLYRGRAPDAAFREEIGIQFQSTALQDFQTVRESLRMFASLYRRTADLAELVAMCNLSEILDRDTRKLSGGQRQRLLLAIALVNDPELVFLDEPTTGLDPQARRNFWSLIETVREREKTLVLTTHYMEEAERLCDEIVIVDRGRIIAQGSPQALVAEHLPGSVVRLPLAAWPDGKPIPPDGEVRNGEAALFTDEVPALLESLADAGSSLHALKVETPNLEDVFLKLTGHDLRS
jgi:ABC-2 type transport system ATP-binding protein